MHSRSVMCIVSYLVYYLLYLLLFVLPSYHLAPPIISLIRQVFTVATCMHPRHRTENTESPTKIIPEYQKCGAKGLSVMLLGPILPRLSRQKLTLDLCHPSNQRSFKHSHTLSSSTHLVSFPSHELTGLTGLTRLTRLIR